MAGISRLAAREIMSLARETFDKLLSQRHIDISAVKKFFSSAKFDLSDAEIKDLELAVVLMASAHNVSYKRFDEARKLLNLCNFLSSYKGNSVQRVVHYFTKALQARIAQETEKIPQECKARKIFQPHQPTKSINPALILCCLQLPCVQISQFAAIQAVIDSLALARKVHFIDLLIKGGEHCPVLMQALANRRENPVEFLKITAIGTPETKQRIEEIGKCLTGLAETLNLPFLFCISMVVDLSDLKKEIFEINADEDVAVFSIYAVRTVRPIPGCLNLFFRFLRNLNPCVLVLIEPEANNSSPIFINRFHESLLGFSSFFECIEACVGQQDPNRLLLEASILGEDIKDIVSAKDDERVIMDMKIEEWRVFLIEFGMVEIEVSISAFNQARLLLNKFSCGGPCLLAKNGKCLITGWKGTPLFSVSAWKFQLLQKPKGSGVRTNVK